MRQQQPIPHNTLRKDIQHGEEDRLSIDAELECQGTSREGTKFNQYTIYSTRKRENVHREQGKHHEGRPRKRPEEASQLRILILRRPLRMESRMVQHNQIPHTGQRQPSPSGPSMSRKSAQNSGRKHDIVSSDCAQEISAG